MYTKMVVKKKTCHFHRSIQTLLNLTYVGHERGIAGARL